VTAVAPIPLVDLAWQHNQIAAEVAHGFESVLATGAFIQGPHAAAFEAEFAAFCGVEHCIGVANGTDAIELALRAVDIGRGAEVVLPANTFVATAEAIARTGATPVFVDCDEDTSLIDVEQVDGRVSPLTGAVIPVHLYGQIAPMESLLDVVPDDVVVIEDAAQAQGATRAGRGIGTSGRVAATSFYPGKNLGAYGDAGAVLTQDAEVARRVRRIGNHGSETKYDHSELGFNSRLDGLQAVVLRAKLGRLAAWNECRRRLAARYNEALAPLADDGLVRLPVTVPGNTHVWHLYVIRVPQRDAVLATLHSAGIAAGIHYPLPVHLHPAFRFLGYNEGAFPAAERLASEILSLPIYPGMSETAQDRVVEELAAALHQCRGAFHSVRA
jgi:dTDP-4-amino-4,6-dideoxygalactose transaminase